MQRPRTTAKLSESLNKRLNAYDLAASAAGVSLLALRPAVEYALPAGAAIAATLLSASSVEAKIIYTPANTVIKCMASHSSVPLDLNHDGIADFSFVCSTASGDGGYAGIVPIPAANKVWQTRPNSHGRSYVAARHAGALIKANRQFRHNSCNITRACRMIEWNRVESHTYSYGPWAGVVDRYLALRFTIEGGIHFGWARLRTKPGIQALYLTGYAYESIPNKPIIAGQTHGEDDIDPGSGASLTTPAPDIPQPTTLGALALGAPGLSIWRREQSVSAGQ